jgi:hypothetical protein
VVIQPFPRAGKPRRPGGLATGRRRAARAALCAALAAGCAAPPAGLPPSAALPPAGGPAPSATPAAPAADPCAAPAWADAAARNAASLATLAWAPFGRAEAGWAAYGPLVQREAATGCAPGTEAFAAAFAAWQAAHGLPPTGVVDAPAAEALKAAWQDRRPFVRRPPGTCPPTPDVIAQARPGEGLEGKAVWLAPGALAAYRRMAAAARAEVPALAGDPQVLTLFSGYRSPTLDAARCAAEGNCDGIARAACSSHRTGLALDLYLGRAPGFMADSTAQPNREFLSRTPAYRWLVRNAGRFGFVNYAFEPWHWEWTGEAR